MTFTDQSAFPARCEWGLADLEHPKPANTVVIVDLLSFRIIPALDDAGFFRNEGLC